MSKRNIEPLRYTLFFNPLLEQTPDSHFVLRLFDKGENDFKDNKTIDSVPLLLRLRWHKYL